MFSAFNAKSGTLSLLLLFGFSSLSNVEASQPSESSASEFTFVVGSGQGGAANEAANAAEADAIIKLQAFRDANPDKIVIVVWEGTTVLQQSQFGWYSEYTIVVLVI